MHEEVSLKGTPESSVRVLPWDGYSDNTTSISIAGLCYIIRTRTMQGFLIVWTYSCFHASALTLSYHYSNLFMLRKLQT